MSQVILAQRLAETSGNQTLTRTEISRWERGKRIPGPYWRGWLSEVLDVPPERLETAATSARRLRRTIKGEVRELAPYPRERFPEVSHPTVTQKHEKASMTVVCRRNPT